MITYDLYKRNNLANGEVTWTLVKSAHNMARIIEYAVEVIYKGKVPNDELKVVRTEQTEVIF